MTPEEKRERSRLVAREWRAKNPERCKAASARYRASHLEQEKARVRTYMRSPAGRAKQAAWVKAHPDERRATLAKHLADPANQAKRRARSRERGATPEGKAYARFQYAKYRDDDHWSMGRNIANARRRAIVRGVAFDDALIDLILDRPLPTTCESCGVVFDYRSTVNGNHSRSPSLDRVDNEKGYIVGNVAVICTRCNALKSNATADELRAIVAYMERHFNGQ